MKKTLIKNAKVVNEGTITNCDILLNGNYIEKISSSISDANATVIDAKGNYVLPGIIDDQVHFREPGLTHKGNIATESKAAVAGGVTTFMEQPNTNPQTTTIEKLEEKFAVAKESSYANYSFLFGGTNDNLEELKKLDKNACSGVKLFLGSSTGNMLVDNEEVIEKIFSNTEMVISAHCEDETTIRKNMATYKEKYGDNIPIEYHPIIRSTEACYLSSSKAIALAEKTGARLHVFHLSTGKETSLFRNDIPLKDKKITAEVCVHHLWFSDEDYKEKGTLIKWNPAVKTAEDRSMLWDALLDDRIDVIATDHAPHTFEEKDNVYTKAPSGGPLVQHVLPAMLEKVLDGTITIERMVEKMCHNPAILFQIEKRGYIKEGYFADLVIVDTNSPWQVSKSNILYKCGWSPFEDYTFKSKISHTFVNGHLAYENGVVSEQKNAHRLTFNR
ncbi:MULTISPECIES: dihydroorotase [Cellulophaga]|uniref:Dihydroorotase, multifunctional complex type n=1 Tax=Cellulophaga lytica (strain ATCC 23178 / DSM 7489 / JCM 8516 / NBRC 14961 / NCIMB 1423 / VKM B-1433 / Cy l20) TaxID=867900 RepID=F0RE58_CELLC|nr:MULTISPECIES: dihydroorotase [Cellulophaga]ADY28820.1 dihydroorotase, multifunctional complex type [Cellulophaga lytica DSM 7489]APU09729.1 dihydroorotase [Cellulophaga lytica]TVZ08612.1 dihydroorotase [Cellulophaga sp. RHA_52]WQG77003.1 dihydroorotase [Cellulophaga lytica]